MVDKLFDERGLRKLEQLQLVASRVRAGVMKGERRSNKRGTGTDFADYRDYSRGDDLRRIDWNVFARLDRPFIKLLEDEQDLSVYLLIDASRSMDWPQDGDNDAHKFTFARRIAAGLAHISLGTGDRLTVTALAPGNPTWGPYRGKGRTLDLLNWLTALRADGPTALNSSLRDFAARMRTPGLCILISDLLAPDGYADGLAALQARGNEVALIHTLAQDEVEPEMSGDLHLVDSETGQAQDVTLDGGMLDLYVRRLAAWRDEIATYCARRGVHYATVQTDSAWEALILTQLRSLGVVH